MSDVTVIGLVCAPPDPVFAFVSDLETWPRWPGDMKAAIRVAGMAGRVGTTYCYTAQAVGQPFDSTMGIVCVVPERSVSFEGEWQGMIRPRGTCTMEAAPDGRRFTTDLAPEARGFWKVMTPLMTLMIRWINRKNVEALQRAFG